MANIVGTYASNQSYNPKFNYSVNYWQTGRTATSVTYTFSVSFSRLNGSYLYDIYVNYSIGGQSGNVLLKANNDGSASGSTSFSVTCSTNASGGTLYARIYSWSNTDGTHWQNGFDTGDKDVNRSTFNTAPYWSSGAVISLSPNGIVREDTSSVTVSWTGASDNETTSGMTYRVDRYVNGNFSATITNSTTGTSITDNIGAWNSGSVYTYKVTPTDNYGVTGGTLTNSQSLTKNTLYASTVSGGATIRNNTSSFTINVSGGGNSMGGGNIYRDINSPNLTMYNQGISTGDITITIYRSGTVPNTPYIKYEDIRNLYKNEFNQSGTFKINVNTANDFGTYRTNSININVDLRDNPNPPSNITTSGTKTINGKSYYIPNIQNITVSWANGSDKINGHALTYEIQGSTNLNGGWTTLANNISSGNGTTSVVVNINSYNAGSNYYFRVIGYNSFSLSASAVSGAIVVHRYSAPTISLGVVTRTTTKMVIPITTILSTSIPNITFASDKRNYSLRIKGASKDTPYVKPSTQLTASPQTVTITGLEANKEYILELVVNDTSGLSTTDIGASLNISKYIPIMSVRDKGIGINAYANNDYKLVVGGNTLIDGSLSVNELNNRGYQTKNTGSGDAGKWGLVATITFNAQYQEVNSIIDYIDSGSGGTNPTSGRLIIRAKQQAAITNAPLATMFLTDYLVSSPESFKLILTENTGSKSVLQLWFRNIQSYSQVYFSPTKTTGATTCITFHEGQSLQTSLPSGTQTPCYKIVNYTPGDIGAMAEGGTYDTLTLYNWIRTSGNTGWYNETYQGGWYMTDGTWIRNYNNKSVYVNTTVRADAGFQVGENGNKFKVGSDGSVSATGEAHFSTGTYTDPLQGTACAIKASGRIACNIVHAQSYRFVETNAQITSRSGSSGGFDFWATGDGGSRITFDGVKIYKVVNGTWTVIAG